MQRCGKGSNLQPRPSEGRALIRLSYRNKYLQTSCNRLALCLLLLLHSEWSRQDSNLH